MNLFVVTPTGGRPEALTRLAFYLGEQTYQGQLTWVIVDDGVTMSPLQETRFKTVHVRPTWRWQPSDNTQCKNMVAGLRLVGGNDTLIVMEDDDCYLPRHIDDTLEALKRYELVGERLSRYYNIRTNKWRIMRSPFDTHSALASVGVRGRALHSLKDICNRGTSTIDLDLWHTFTGLKFLTEKQNVVGIKGVPGRGGIGVGHRPGFGQPDPGGILRDWIGSRADFYEHSADL